MPPTLLYANKLLYLCVLYHKVTNMTHTPKRYLITAALPYANGPLHIGHLTGAYIPADIYVRYLRLHGEDVKFVCGSDEHGAAITIRAKQEGITPRQIVDKYHAINKQAFEQIGISFDIYHRTSDALHYQTSQEVFKQLFDQGVFTERETEQYYDEQYQQFLADRYITGTCPRCHNEGAYGDQCEKCGSTLSPTDLINPKSMLSGNPPILKPTLHWYLPMNQYETWVKNWIETNQQSEPWKKHVLGQCRSWVEQGLQERSMTRDLNWGVPVPLPGAEGKVIYVWLDAPIGYISATKALLPHTWQEYWQNPDTKLVHFIGKDNIVFHCIIFPIILHALGNYTLPANVPANQFMNLEGEKMSTSRNYAVWLHEYLAEFPGKEDVLRFVLTANMPEQKDSDFSWADFQAKNNNELVAILGNLVNRAIVLIHKYYGGKLPVIAPTARKMVYAEATEVFTTLQQAPIKLHQAIHQYEFRNALNVIMDVARAGNKFLTETEPWKRHKQNPDETAAILEVCLLLIGWLGVYIEPFLPLTAAKISRQLRLTTADVVSILAGTYSVEPEAAVNPPELLFEKIDDAAIALQTEKLTKAKAAYEAAKNPTSEQTEPPLTDETPAFAPLKELIQYDDFARLDLRIATITAAEKVPKADKLLKLTLDVGFETRTVVSGIAEHHQPDAIVGKQVLLLANLAPRKLRGIESQGMILMADSQGKLIFVAPTHAAYNGSGVN
ncbi:MAG TPA: methionine--tRNA ligase [Chitinophagales bacterium]|nr:methionine--tRNA ligase [Chitinophagales bacterium]HRK26197.1 methionine--tRNA ligase [Chitinophagales bacterium]